jgi:hypothetical protein
VRQRRSQALAKEAFAIFVATGDNLLKPAVRGSYKKRDKAAIA